MLVFLFLASFTACIAFLILSIIGFIKKNGKGKKYLLTAGACFLASIFLITIEMIINPVYQEITLKVTNEVPTEVETTQDTILVEGTVENAEQLTINDKTVTIEDDSFSTKVPVNEGENSIIIFARNKEYSKELKYDVIRAYPPVELDISYDSNIEVPSYELKGTVQPGATVTLNKDNSKLGEITSDENGVFSFNLDTKAEGTYNYTVSATKDKFTDEEMKISITRTIPTIPLTVKPVNEVHAATYTIKGETEPGATVTITKGEKKLDQLTASKDGSFSVKVNTKEAGEYKYTIKATKGNFKDQTKDVAFTRILSAKMPHFARISASKRKK